MLSVVKLKGQGQKGMRGIENLHPRYQQLMRERYLRASRNWQKQMISFLRRIPPPEELTREWFLEFLDRPSARGGQLSNDSVAQYLARMKILANWLERPEIVEGIKKPRARKLTRADILEMNEVRHLLQSAPDSRTRALIHLLAETGLRIDEALSIQIEEIVADGTRQRIIDGLGNKDQIMGRMWKIQIDRSKTFARAVFAYESTPSLLAWIVDHPVKKGHLFIAKRRREKGVLVYPQLSYQGAYELLTRAYVNAGYQDERELRHLQKGLEIHPGSKSIEERIMAEMAKPMIPKRRIHILRHSAGTQMAKDRVHPSMMNRAMGWSPGSHAPNIYIHLIDEDVEEEMRRRYGLTEATEKREIGINSWHCPICGSMNPPTTGICLNCPPKPQPADERINEMQERLERLEMQRVERNEEVSKMLQDFLKELGKKEKL
jgi:integrase